MRLIKWGRKGKRKCARHVPVLVVPNEIAFVFISYRCRRMVNKCEIYSISNESNQRRKAIAEIHSSIGIFLLWAIRTHQTYVNICQKQAIRNELRMIYCVSHYGNPFINRNWWKHQRFAEFFICVFFSRSVYFCLMNLIIDLQCHFAFHLNKYGYISSLRINGFIAFVTVTASGMDTSENKKKIMYFPSLIEMHWNWISTPTIHWLMMVKCRCVLI